MADVAVEQALQIALQHHQAGRHAEAESLYRQILAHDPNHPHALHFLGVLASQLNHHGPAVDLIRRAIALRPNYAEAYSNLGNALVDLGDFDAAIAACRQAVALRPDLAPAHNNLGNALWKKGDLHAAIAAARQAIALNPQDAKANNVLGNALSDKGDLDGAIVAYRRSIELEPDYAEAHNNLATTLCDKGDLDEALAACRRGIALRPTYPEAYNNLGHILKAMGQLDEAIAGFRQAIVLNPDYIDAHSNLLLALNYHPDSTAEGLLEESRRWAARHAEPLRPLIQSHPNNRDPDRRLKIGYVSPDLRDHVVGRALLPLLAECDASQIENICYSHGMISDAMTQRLRTAADQWRETRQLSRDQLADRIRQDQIDILIDLSGHSCQHRLPTFALKAAPIQVTWLGYPGTTGMSAMDYRLTDPCLDPPDVPGRDTLYTERSIRLPDNVFCYQPGLPTPDVNRLPALANGRVTFGCLNNLCKVTAPTLALWTQILHRIPSSDLLLYARIGQTRQRILNLLASGGIDPARIHFAGHGGAKYFEFYHHIDISLDPFPFTGSTTTCDSLWMGVPVITLAGPMLASRLSLTILNTLGLTNWAANDTPQYLQIATALATDLPALSQTRSTQRTGRPLFEN